ncbi:hypothetical protein JVT61DRAFT_12303 [Boletus reticuloceps]|uniref:Uncharacterized protein n=1 Tax=Boletus reticuloceps TaxID=495285 RepID=A0A8I3A3K3_9AGAM|nr:hypothetical protein JVT61DRAFT_12303 [Boletus reticuloceps]
MNFVLNVGKCSRRNVVRKRSSPSEKGFSCVNVAFGVFVDDPVENDEQPYGPIARNTRADRKRNQRGFRTPWTGSTHKSESSSTTSLPRWRALFHYRYR